MQGPPSPSSGVTMVGDTSGGWGEPGVFNAESAPQFVRSYWWLRTSDAIRVELNPSLKSAARRLRFGPNAVRLGKAPNPPQTYQSPMHHPTVDTALLPKLASYDCGLTSLGQTKTPIDSPVTVKLIGAV